MNTSLLILLLLVFVGYIRFVWLDTLHNKAKQRTALLSNRISTVLSIVDNDSELKNIADKAVVIHILAEKPGNKGLSTLLKIISAVNGIYLRLIAFERTMGIEDQVFETLSDENKIIHKAMQIETLTRRI